MVIMIRLFKFFHDNLITAKQSVQLDADNIKILCVYKKD